MIEITLPWPPTVNTYWRTFNGRVLISAKGREYRKAVADQVLIQRAAKHIDYAMKVTIAAYRPDRRRRDLDNLRIYWADEIGGMVKVTIEGIE